MSVSWLKLFEIPVSLAGLYAVPRTVSLFAAKTATQRVRTCAMVFMAFIIILRKKRFSPVGRLNKKQIIFRILKSICYFFSKRFGVI
jgi:uncharacterized membrane protein